MGKHPDDFKGLTRKLEPIDQLGIFDESMYQAITIVRPREAARATPKKGAEDKKRDTNKTKKKPGRAKGKKTMSTKPTTSKTTKTRDRKDNNGVDRDGYNWNQYNLLMRDVYCWHWGMSRDVVVAGRTLEDQALPKWSRRIERTKHVWFVTLREHDDERGHIYNRISENGEVVRTPERHETVPGKKPRARRTKRQKTLREALIVAWNYLGMTPPEGSLPTKDPSMEEMFALKRERDGQHEQTDVAALFAQLESEKKEEEEAAKRKEAAKKASTMTTQIIPPTTKPTVTKPEVVKPVVAKPLDPKEALVVGLRVQADEIRAEQERDRERIAAIEAEMAKRRENLRAVVTVLSMNDADVSAYQADLE